MSNPFSMVVAIVALVAIARVATAWITRRHQPGGVSDDALARRDAQIAQLEQRVAALEAVVADQSYELKQKFRDLERA